MIFATMHNYVRWRAHLKQLANFFAVIRYVVFNFEMLAIQATNPMPGTDDSTLKLNPLFGKYFVR